MLTTNKIVKAIKDKFGFDVELFKGDGYYYFVGECVDNCKSSSVYVNSLNSMTLEMWLFDFNNIIEKKN